MGVRNSKTMTVDFEAIAAIMRPTNAEWWNATIELVDPRIAEGTFDRTTNTKSRPSPTVLWSGPARIQAMRWPNVATTRQEAVSERTVVFHIPVSEDVDPQLVLEGFRVRVTSSPLAREFEQGLFVIVGTVNSSYDWDRRIECVMDQGTRID